jgi:mRNA-degrading endonuclease RelE of RelBE toxin-antitoxin system
LFFDRGRLNLIDMKKVFLFIIAVFLVVGNLQAQRAVQTKSTTKTTETSLDKLAKKRTQLLKDQLFLSLDQTSEILQINIDMLKRLETLNKQKIDKSNYKKQLDQIETSTKNKIVSLLTPAQRQRFETKLFSEVYQTHIDKRKAVSKK